MAPLPVAVRVALGLLGGYLAAGAGPGGLVLVGATSLVPLAVARARALRPVALAMILGAVAGARAAAAPREDAVSARLPEAGIRVVADGTIVAAEPPSPTGTAFVLDVDAWTTGEGTTRGASRWKGIGGARGPGEPMPALHPGDRVRLAGTVSPVPPPTNPGGFDGRAAWARQGVFARLDVPEGACVERLEASDGLRADIARARHGAAARLDRALAPDDAGLLRSLLLGDRGALAPADRARFLRAGAAHILAISGAHVALLVAGLLHLLRRFRLPSRVAAGVVLVAVLLFVPFTGSSPPVVRSAVGFALFLVGRLVGREPSGGVLLATVVVGYLAVDPTAGEDPGFRMSFAAATGLLLLAGRLRRAMLADPLVHALRGGRPPRAPIRSALAAGLAAWLASTPVTIHDLGQSGWVAIPVGLVAVPLSTAAMAVGVAVVACADVPLVDPALRAAEHAILGVLRACLDAPLALGIAQGPVERPPTLWYATYVAAFVVAARARAGPAVLGGATLVALLAGLAHDPTADPPDHVRLTLLDVGHGQAALLETPSGERALFDAGSRDRPDVAERVVLPALRALGIASLDLIVASHADADHAGALPAVAATLAVHAAVVPPRFDPDVDAAIRPHVERVLVASDGDVLLAGAWGRVVVLGPVAHPPFDRSENDACLVLALETAGGRVLLPGDREERGVADLLAAHPDLTADLLVLPHHGLPGAGRERLMRAVRPALLLASTAPAAVALLPAATLATGRRGAVTIDLRPDGPVLSTPFARDRRPREYDPAPPAMADLATLALALVVLAVIVTASIRLRWLDAPAALAAGVLGALAVAAFSWAGLAALLAPFLVATLLGKLPGDLAAGGPRVVRQVLANGLPAVPGIAVALAGVAGGAAAFAGALAALGADTVATELGTRYGGVPRHALSFRPLARGESGGVTLVGLVASVVGGVLAPIAMAAAGGLACGDVAAVGAAGVVAGYADSALGAALQRKGRCGVCGKTVETPACCGAAPARLPGRLAFLDNDGVNVGCGLVGAAVAWLVTR